MKKEEFAQKFAKNLKKIIKNNFNSQKEFAEEIEENRTTVVNWCSGKTMPDAYKLSKIANYMGVTVDYVLNGNSEEDSFKHEFNSEVFDKVYDFLHKTAKKAGKKKFKGSLCITLYNDVVSNMNTGTSLENALKELEKLLLDAWA